MAILVSVAQHLLHRFKPRRFESSQQSDMIPIRHMKINFKAETLNPRFYLNSELASAYFSSLSIFLTYGEELVIDTARYHRKFLQDARLKQRVTALIGQEALHSKVHEELNEALKEADFPVQLFRSMAQFVFNYGFNRLPQPMKLSLMAAIEHFTAVLAEYMMQHEEIFFHSCDDQQRAIWMWHMLEESEHKDIAYDVFQDLSNHYGLRIAGFFPAFITILVLIMAAACFVPLYRRPKNLISFNYWRSVPEGWQLLFGLKKGVYGSSWKHIFAYLHPRFHPNDFDTTAHLAYYKIRLLDPKNGILAPYFVKEFTPALTQVAS